MQRRTQPTSARIAGDDAEVGLPLPAAINKASQAGQGSGAFAVAVRNPRAWLQAAQRLRIGIAIAVAIAITVLLAGSWSVFYAGGRGIAKPVVKSGISALAAHAKLVAQRRLLVVSPGGVGTTYIMERLKQTLGDEWVLNSPGAVDMLKHGRPTDEYVRMLTQARCPAMEAGKVVPGRAPGMVPTTVPCPRKFVGMPHAVLYLFSDPLLAVRSHFRRGTVGSVLDQMHPAGRAALPLDGSLDYDAYVDAVMRAGDDLFGFEQHLRAWLTAPMPSARMLFVDSFTLMRNTTLLEQLLLAPQGSLSGAFEAHARAASLADEPAAYLSIYRRLYDTLRVYDGFYKPALQ